jgi:hypothetical protein
MAHPYSCPVDIVESYPGAKATGDVKLTTHLYLVPMSRMRGAIYQLPQYVFTAWYLVKHMEDFAVIVKDLLHISV